MVKEKSKNSKPRIGKFLNYVVLLLMVHLFLGQSILITFFPDLDSNDLITQLVEEDSEQENEEDTDSFDNEVKLSLINSEEYMNLALPDLAILKSTNGYAEFNQEIPNPPPRNL